MPLQSLLGKLQASEPVLSVTSAVNTFKESRKMKQKMFNPDSGAP